MLTTFDTGRQAQLYVGAGGLSRLAELSRSYNAKSALVVTDAGIRDSGLLDRVITAVGDELRIETFVAPNGEPHLATVDAGAEAVRRLDTPIVIGVGGGTALDIAKLLAALAVSPGSMSDYLLAKTPWSGRTLALMIPTTSGTGSEVTRTSIVADANGLKQWAWGNELLPDAVLLDPELTRSLPRSLTAATGLDALIHALEATTGKGRHSFIQAPALEAIRLVGRALPQAIREPNDLVARQQMQAAACLAGQAIDNGGTGLGHNIGHALGSLYHLPHGIAVTLGVEATLAWSIEGNEDIFEPSANALRQGASPRELPTLFSELVDAVHFNEALATFASRRLDPAALAEAMQAEENAPMAHNAARQPGTDDWQALAKATVALFEQRVSTLTIAEESPA